ncbi:MAG: hypothetical protein WCA09_12815 [Burkholderiales bacterium]
MIAAKPRRNLDLDRTGDRDHPVAGWVGLIAIAITIVLLVWVRLAVIGSQDIEEVFAETPDAAGPDKGAGEEQAPPDHEIDEAVMSSRWATGFSP